MAVTAKGTPYVVSTDLVANYPTVSSDLATHIDAKLQYNAQTINAQTGSGANAYTFALDDASLYKLVTATNAAAATYTVPPQSAVTWVDGAILRILNQGAGVVTLAGGSGVTLNGVSLTLSQYQYAEIQRTASNTWTVTGIATTPGLTKIADASFSAQSTISVNDCFSATYDNYRLVLYFDDSANADLNMRLRVSGADNTTSNYSWVFSGANYSGAAAYSSGGSATNLWRVGGTTTNHLIGPVSIDIYGPFLSQATLYTGGMNDEARGGSSAGRFDANTSFTGFTIFPTTGTTTGRLVIYGYRN